MTDDDIHNRIRELKDRLRDPNRRTLEYLADAEELGKLQEKIPVDPEAILRQCFEHVEVAYLQAKEAGANDPVIWVRDLGFRPDVPERPGVTPFGIMWRERAETIEAFREGLPEEAQRVRSPRPGCCLTVALFSGAGLTIHDRIAPPVE